ncbi:MAG: symmetrical bis(5'-nucleosyl)-tetraphosphatase [Porticoccaceae bacterium]
MSIYAVGDIQGCLDPLRELLNQVGFDPRRDQLWSVGDTVNRGPQSLATLRFLKNLGAAFRMVLGNHDLHLLAVARGLRKRNPKDTLDEILMAPDRDELLAWLQRQPLLIQQGDMVLVHAGIPPQWSLAQARAYAAEVEAVLGDDRAESFLASMYGNQPDCWLENLTGIERWRVITNYFTRMRFCDANGRLELSTKLGPERPPVGFAPWFSHPARKTADIDIVFGHWATLLGRDCGPRLFPLDTGCVWGQRLRLLSVEQKTYRHSVCGGTSAK